MKKFVKNDSASPSTEYPIDTQFNSPRIQPPIHPFQEEKVPFQTSNLGPIFAEFPRQNDLKRDFSQHSDCTIKLEQTHQPPKPLQSQFAHQKNAPEMQEMYEKFMWMQNQSMFFNCLQQNYFMNMNMNMGMGMGLNMNMNPLMGNNDMQQNFHAYQQMLSEKMNKKMNKQGQFSFDSNNNNNNRNKEEGGEEKRRKKSISSSVSQQNNNREETKNLLKIYSLGFHKYIEHTFVEMFGVKKCEIMGYLQNNRLESYTLKGLRQMWEKKEGESEDVKKYNRIIRIYCKRFLQTEALSYFLTHSRTKNPFIILKYRSVLLQFLYEPQNLRYLKLRDSGNSNDLNEEQGVLRDNKNIHNSKINNNSNCGKVTKKIKKFGQREQQRGVKVEEDKQSSEMETVKI